jgi:hypothetical protein
MVNDEERGFKLSLTIQDNPGLPGAHAAIGLIDGEDGVPTLAITAGGFPPTPEGAAELADMLQDAAEAIRSHLPEGVSHHAVEDLPRVHFNPQPRRFGPASEH